MRCSKTGEGHIWEYMFSWDLLSLKKYVGYSGRVSEHSNLGQDLRCIRMVIMTLGIVSILVKVEYCG